VNCNLQIERVENQPFYQRYLLLKKELEGKLFGSSFATESKLFHGTSEESVLKICSVGFNRSLAGANGEEKLTKKASEITRK